MWPQKNIYCISGMGADEKAFSQLHVPGYELKVIGWLQPSPHETIQQYASRMSEFIEEENPLLMGLSFGGMLCTEIAKQISVEKIIIISSIKNSMELPFWMKTVAKLSLHKIVPLKSTRLTEPLQNRFLGVSNLEEKKIARNYRKNANPAYIKWAVNEVVNWKNEWHHPYIYHIHGDKDKIFPIKKIHPTYTVKGGGHFMIMNKAGEVSQLIQFILINAPAPAQ